MTEPFLGGTGKTVSRGKDWKSNTQAQRSQNAIFHPQSQNTVLSLRFRVFAACVKFFRKKLG